MIKGRISRLLGNLLFALGLTMGLCLPVAYYYGEPHRVCMAISMACTCMCGAIFFCGVFSEDTVYRRDALAVVGFGGCSWTLRCPALLCGWHLSPLCRCLFQPFLVYTTGATVLTDIESRPKALLFWRMTSHWLGGMGIIVLFVAIFPQIGVGAKQLFRSEVPGPMTEGLWPKIKETALALWKIYACMTASAALLFMLFGMHPFDAICHAPPSQGDILKNASVGHFNSLGIDVITTLFMLLAGLTSSASWFSGGF